MSGPKQWVPFAPLWAYYGRWARSRDVDPSVLHLAWLLDVNQATIHHWRAERHLLVHTADRAALALGVHPIEIWGATWLDVLEVEVSRKRRTAGRTAEVLLFPPVDWTVMRPLRAAALAESLALRGIVERVEEARTA